VSTGTKPQVLLPAYDAQDLRRRMLVCFTIGEMFALAAKLQVPQPPSWSNNPQEAARDIVRHFERSGALAFLVEALREAKPLVEWPEPLPLPVPPAPPPTPPPAAPAVTAPAASPVISPAPTVSPVASPIPAASPAPTRGTPPSGAAGGSTILGVPAPQALEYADTALEAPGDRATPITDVPAAMIEAATPGASHPPTAPVPAGFAPSVMRRPGEAPPDSPPPKSPSPALSTPLPISAPAAGPAFSSAALPPPGPTQAMPASDTLQDPLRAPPVSRPQPAWPGTNSASNADKKLPNPYVLMAVGTGILLVLIGVAFLAGRASSSSPSTASGTTSGNAGPPPDHVSLSQTAADALGTSLLRVAKACQIDPSTLRGRSLFEVAYMKCGSLPTGGLPEPTGPRPTTYDPAPDPTDPAASADPDPAPTGGKKGTRPPTKSTKPQALDTPPPPTGGGGCLPGCSRSHAQCTSRCGAEPQQGSQYDAYQSCLGGCLKALSQCKMGCN